MKKLIIGFLSVMLALTVAAEDKDEKETTGADNSAVVTLSGTVYDSESGELLVGVEVLMENPGTKTYTDLDGNFTFENVNQGEHKLVTNYISYKKGSEVCKVDLKNNEVNIKMETSR